MLKRIRWKLANWLLKGIELDEVLAKKIRSIGGNTAYLDKILLDSLTSDPSLSTGLMWFRSDLGRMRYYNGAEVISLDPPAELKFERYADVEVAAGGAYTPADSGLFHGGGIRFEQDYFRPEYYSTTLGTWRPAQVISSSGIYPAYGNFIGDGSNFRVKNNASNAYTLILMRCYT